MDYSSFSQSKMYKQSSFELYESVFLNIAWSYFREKSVWGLLGLDPQGALSCSKSIIFSCIHYLTEYLFLIFSMSYEKIFSRFIFFKMCAIKESIDVSTQFWFLLWIICHQFGRFLFSRQKTRYLYSWSMLVWQKIISLISS